MGGIMARSIHFTIAACVLAVSACDDAQLAAPKAEDSTPQEWRGRWTANPFAGTKRIEIEHRRKRGPSVIYRIKNPQVIAALVDKIAITGIWNGISPGVIVSSEVKFVKRDGTVFGLDVLNYSTFRATDNSLMYLEPEFCQGLIEHLNSTRGAKIDLLEDLPATEETVPKTVAQTAPVQLTSPMPEDRERMTGETTAMVVRDLPRFLELVIAVRLSDKQGVGFYAAEPLRPLLKQLPAQEFEALNLTPQEWQKRIGELSRQGATQLALTPGLGYDLWLIESGDKQAVIPYYGQVTLTQSLADFNQQLFKRLEEVGPANAKRAKQ